MILSLSGFYLCRRKNEKERFLQPFTPMPEQPFTKIIVYK